MKLKVSEILENWEKWVMDKGILEYDAFVEVEGIEHELLGIDRSCETISYIDKENNMLTIPASRIEYVRIRFY